MRTLDGVAPTGPAETGSKTESRMEALIGSILLVGILSSAGLVIAGLLWHLMLSGNLRLQYSISGMNLFQFLLIDLQQLFSGQIRPRLLVNLGIVVLILTPYTRVLASVSYFALRRNWKYVVLTAGVLGVLTYTLFLH